MGASCMHFSKWRYQAQEASLSPSLYWTSFSPLLCNRLVKPLPCSSLCSCTLYFLWLSPPGWNYCHYWCRLWPTVQCTLFSQVHYFILSHFVFWDPFRIEHRTLPDGTHSVSFHIPWTKTTKEVGASVVLTAQEHSLLCPIAALQNHLTINASIPPSFALFAYTVSSGHFKNLLKHEFLAFVTDIWSSAGLAHVLGHSFCIGGATELPLAGVPPEVVAAIGGWTSLMFLLYWHRMEEILPMSTSKAYKKSHFDNLASIFEQFHINQKIPAALITASDSLNIGSL